MKALWQPLLEQGGPVVVAILVLSVVLYTRCFSLLIHLVGERRRIVRECRSGATTLAALREWKEEMQDAFQRQRFTLGAMIAAAPLLGLLGTVTGMISTFGTLADRAGQRSMEDLAKGISEALIATKAGLTVAIPAVLLVYYAHRQLQKGVQTAARFEHAMRQET